MASEININDLNPLKNIGSAGGLGSLGTILLVFFIVVLIIGGVGLLIYMKSVKKKYWIVIKVSRLIGGVPQEVATYSAREVAFGMAGDKLWKVAPAGMMKFKTIKWLPVGKLQSAPRVFKYWIRSDGEWINYIDDNIDEISRKMGVRFTQEDMRLQRLATERLLEQRLMNKTFWEKWGTTVMMIIVFLVIAVCMVVIFYQFSKIIDKFSEVVQVQAETSKILLRVFGENYLNETLSGGNGLVPA